MQDEGRVGYLKLVLKDSTFEVARSWLCACTSHSVSSALSACTSHSASSALSACTSHSASSVFQGGSMTKDLAICVHGSKVQPNQYLNTEPFMDAVATLFRSRREAAAAAGHK
jgi:hypothetical protein